LLLRISGCLNFDCSMRCYQFPTRCDRFAGYSAASLGVVTYSYTQVSHAPDGNMLRARQTAVGDADFTT
jgi:hypothetical protein